MSADSVKMSCVCGGIFEVHGLDWNYLRQLRDEWDWKHARCRALVESQIALNEQALTR